MTPDGQGVYRWRYSVNLYKNPGLLWLFYKVFGGIFAGCLLFVLFLGDFKVSPEGAKWTSVGFAVMIAGAALCLSSAFLWIAVSVHRRGEADRNARTAPYVPYAPYAPYNALGVFEPDGWIEPFDPAEPADPVEPSGPEASDGTDGETEAPVESVEPEEPQFRNRG